MNTQPRLFCNPITHIQYSGGNYFRHLWFGLQGVSILAVALVTGLIHAIFPFVFPFVADHLSIQLGKKCEDHHRQEAKRRQELGLSFDSVELS